MAITSSSSTGTLTASGVGSGLDVNSIVSQLMTVEKRPLTLLQAREASFQTQLSTLGQVKSGVSAVKDAAEALKKAITTPAWSATVGTPAVLTVTTSATAAAGTHAINVTQLAQAHIVAAAGQASASAAIGSGAATTLTLDFGGIAGGTFNAGTGTYSGAAFTPNTAKAPVVLTIDGTNNSLEGIRDAINGANAGVTASIVNDGGAAPYRLVLRAQETGSANSLRVTVTGDAAVSALLAHDPAGVQNLAQTQAAVDARLTVDGIAVTKASNTITDVLAGVTLRLAQTGTTTLGLQSDASAFTTALTALAGSYNFLNAGVSSVTGAKAVLQGDYATIASQRVLRAALGSAVSGAPGSYTMLSQIGGSFAKDGTLTIDAAKLQAALTADRAGVYALATRVAEAASTGATSFVSTSGALTSRINGLNQSLTSLQKQETQLQTRLTLIEARYKAQYTSLDTLVAGMKKTSDYLTQQLAQLPGSYSGN